MAKRFGTGYVPKDTPDRRPETTFNVIRNGKCDINHYKVLQLSYKLLHLTTAVSLLGTLSGVHRTPAGHRGRELPSLWSSMGLGTRDQDMGLVGGGQVYPMIGAETGGISGSILGH